MSVDTSIYQNLLRPPKSVAEYDAEAMAGQQNKLSLMLGQQKADEYARSVTDANRLRGLVSGFGADRGANYNALVGAGHLAEAQKYAEENAKTAELTEKTRGEAMKSDGEHIKNVNLKMGQVRDLFTTINTPQQAAQLVQGMYSDPDIARLVGMNGDTVEAAMKRIPQDPAGFVQWKQAASLNAEKLATYTTPDANTKEQGRVSMLNNATTNATSRANNASSNAVQMRGQNMTDARGREFNATAREEAKAKTATGKAPTEFQGKSAAFGARADQADKIITSLEGKYSPSAIGAKQAVGKAWLIGGALESGGNALLSENDQRAEQAQRDFINAVLRQESGAAIGESEFENAKRQYFPQPNDKPAALKQKAENRRLAVKGFSNSAGKAAFSTDAPAPSSGLPAGWSVEAH